MANIGTVQSVTGLVRAIAEDGTERILSVGDRVAENEKIITGDGVIVIAFTDGTVLDLGSNSSVVLNDDVLNPDGEQTAQSRSEAENEVAALQEALANDPNFDPSALPATAAGPAAGGTDDNNGHTVVSVDYLNPRAPVEAGFDTIGISQEFLQPEEELPPVIEDGSSSTGDTTAFVDEDDLGEQESREQFFDESPQAVKAFSFGILDAFQESTGCYAHYAYAQGNNDVQEGDDIPVDSSTTVTGILNANFGSDGPGAITFNAADTQPVGDSSGGYDLEYWVSDDGYSLVAYIAPDGYEGDVKEVIFTAQITDPTTGDYTTTLYGPVDHADGSTEDNLVIDLGYTITDSNGDSAEGVLAYDIDDDTPLAVDDGTDSVTEDTGTVLSGNVLTNDVVGADTPATFTEWDATANAAEVADLGTYGALSLNGDGSYSFDLDDSLAKVQALTTSDTKTFTLDYKMEDADGDESDATLTIEIKGATDTQGVTVKAAGETAVYETALVDGRNELSNPALNSDTREVVKDTFDVSATDGIKSVSVGGTSFTVAQLEAFTEGSPSGVIDTGEGSLVITGYTANTSNADYDLTATISFTYTLKDAVTNALPADTYADDTGTAIIVTGQSDVPSTAADLVIRIHDDTPLAVNDTGSVDEDGDSLVVGAALGVVQSNDVLGADGSDLSGPVTAVSGQSGDIVGGSTLGLYGTLVLNADGSYTYTVDNANATVDALNVGETIDDVFSYTIKDGDGDTSIANLTITINGAVDAFPSGLAYTIAGQKGITGSAKDTLYAVDLETGEATTIGQISTGGVTFTSVEGLALNPVDGFLYAIAGGAGSTDYLVKINPATGDSDIIATYALASFSDAGLAFSKDGTTLYMATGSVLNTIDPLTGTLTPFIANTGTGAIDGMGISPTDQSTLYIISADDLYTVDIATKVVTLVGNVTFVDLLGDAINSATADGMSFDDNGQLWVDDNAGNIFRYNFSTNTAEQVSTVANEDVTGSGIASLAISVVDPGTYVVLSDAHNVDFSQNRAINESIYLDKDLAADNVPLTNILSETNSITVSDAADNAVTVTQNSGDIESAYIQSDANGDITVTGFVNVDVQTRGDDASSIVVNGAERGNITTGEGGDSVTINAASGSGGLAVDGSETFTIDTDGGNDTITLSDLIDSNYTIDAGEAMDGTYTADDIDTVVIDGDLNLGTGPVSVNNVEIIDITGTGANTLILSVADVLGATDNSGTLIIQGDNLDALVSSDNWSSVGTQDGVDGVTYNAYTSGLATILVENVDVTGIL